MPQKSPSKEASGLDRMREEAAALRRLLDIIRDSRDDEWPVFDAILDSAQRLCNTPISALILATSDDPFQKLAAQRNIPEGAVRMFNTHQMPVDRDTSYAARSIVDGKLIQFEDMGESELYRAGSTVVRAMVDEMNIRSVLFVPLIQGNRAIGTITLFRHKIEPFEQHQIDLVETFAAQAVIAIEKVRQFREVQTRLERERASSEVLEAISRCREDETPVFEAVLRNARILCNASTSALLLGTPEDAQLRLVSVNDADFDQQTSDAHMERARSQPIENDPELHLSAWAICRGETVHVADLRDTDWYTRGVPSVRYIADEVGQRTTLSVPLMDGDRALGAINLHRRTVTPFSEDEIALVRAFATQAVIAIQNVRQFREVQTRLEREAATREILQVISQSRDDEAPVFDKILQKASELCSVPDAALMLLGPTGTHYRIRAHRGSARIDLSETREWAVEDPLPISQSFREARTIHLADMEQCAPYLAGDPTYVRMVEEEGLRSRLCVPLIKGAEAFGVIALSRYELAPFSKGEIDLIETFAAQAVIAIENVHQFREVQERLEREKASAEILQVISQSRDDEARVFDVLLEKAALLCHAKQATLQLVNDARTQFFLAGGWGLEKTAFPIGKEWPLEGDQPVPKAILTGQCINIADLKDTDYYRAGDPIVSRIVDSEGVRSRLVVPLMQKGIAIGTISVSRREVTPFDDLDIQLVETFAAQAVIAVENVRQFRELQTKLEHEAATSEVLSAISQSRDDDQRVFDTLLEKAVALSQSAHGSVWLLDKEGIWLETVARNEREAARSAGFDRRRMDDPGSAVATCVRDQSVRRIDDLQALPGYNNPEFPNHAWIRESGARSMLLVPLVSGGVGIGMLAMYRADVQPYSDKDVTLIEGFAAQAVIAIENTRQFRALESLNAELGDRVQEQVGEIERMGKLKRFLPPAVADTVLSQGSDKMLSSHRALLGVLFCDIRGFTAFCETAEPEETIEVLQTYHEEMGKLINAHGAGVDHRMGDGIMVLFNDPLPCEDPAGDALRLAIAMRERMSDLCKSWKRMGHRLGFGVGISLGYATVGMVGFEGRFDYTASGTAVNLASRLCDEAADGEILLSPRAAVAVEDDYKVISTGEAQLKGLREPLEVFRLSDA